MTMTMTTSVARSFISFPIKDFATCKQQMLDWANQFSTCCFFDNHHYSSRHNTYECILAAGSKRTIKAQAGNAFDLLRAFYDETPDWLFGHFGYDLKNELETLHSDHADYTGFPDMFFFVPEYIIKLSDTGISINSETGMDAQAVYQAISSCKPLIPDITGNNSPAVIHSRYTREEYISAVEQLKKHILKGDCYEVNFCQEFYAQNISALPLDMYRSLEKISPNPFSAFYRTGAYYLLCASPERYIKKTNNTIISQPIKGTWIRDLDNEAADLDNKKQLYNSKKNRAENVMVVDLVRNDLSRVCEEGTVKVDELYGIYSFPQVHQMISTISGEVKAAMHWIDIIKATFPMASMTGAPKKRVMELIEQYERTRRGIFSGAAGYVTPAGDFDFNVVIRSILLNTSTRYLSYQVGSAITFNSDPEQEYDECLIKAAAINRVLT